MLLNNFLKDPLVTLQYAERYINDGSPSGFSSNTTSEFTSPFGATPNFRLYNCRSSEAKFYTYGSIPKWSDSENCLLIHPDMVEVIQNQTHDVQIEISDEIKVVPTSSGRTVQIIDGFTDHDYVKLHYEGILGRFPRSLPLRKAVAGPEISQILSNALLLSNQLPDTFAFFPETGARIMTIPGNNNEIGMVWRSSNIKGAFANRIRGIIPFFSLFSKDRYAENDVPVLLQILNGHSLAPKVYVTEKLLIPIIQCYFSLITHLGLQPEWNAQNLLVAIDKDCNIIGIVMRDLGETDKDVTIRDSLGLINSFMSTPYKCIKNDQNDYQARHSFMFDFKVSEYVIEPLLRLICNAYNYDPIELQKEIIEIVSQHTVDLPKDFFPSHGQWYKFEKVVFSQRYEYVCCENAKYRPRYSR